MRVREALERINYNVGSLDDVTGKAINPIVTNRIIIYQLNTQLQQYANITKGIEDVYSFPLESNTPFVEAPELALRSESYAYGYVISRGTIFPIDMRSPRDVLPRFRVNPVMGITNWFMAWHAGRKKFLSMFPMNSVTRVTTNLTSEIKADAVTIPITSSTGLINNHGRVTIGSEKILYERKDATNLYGCVRGVEQTTASYHPTNEVVYENNVILFYARLPVPIIIRDDSLIEKTTLDREIEVVDEHLEGVLKAVSYNILVKVDPERASVYKMDYNDLYGQYARDIKKGHWRGRQGTGIRGVGGSENGQPYGSVLGY